MRRLAVVVFLLVPCLSFAKEGHRVALSIGLWTKHVDTSDDTNENSLLFALSYSDWVAGRFVNSYDNVTYFAGKRFHTDKYRRLRNRDLWLQGNFYLGILHGYGDELPNLGGFTVGPLPTVGLGYKAISVEAIYFPTLVGGVFSSFVTVEFEM